MKQKNHNKYNDCPYCNTNISLPHDKDRKIFNWHLNGHDMNHYKAENTDTQGRAQEALMQDEDCRLFEEVYWDAGNLQVRKGTRLAALLDFMFSAKQKAFEAGRKKGGEVNENTSDGYHTFKELYEFRLLYNAHLFNEWAVQGKHDVHKSQRHNDGKLCFGRDDYFIVVATLPTGQISNHYPMSDWDLFKCEAVEKAKTAWDGHTSQDVAKRLRQALTNK